MSYLTASLDAFTAAVESATPPDTAAGATPRQPFTALAPGGLGRGHRLEAMVEADRYFQWVITAWPSKPTERATARVTVGVSLEIRHELTGDERADERRIADDLVGLIARMRRADLWDQATTRVVFLVQDGEPTAAVYPEEGDARFAVTSIPFRFQTIAEGY